MICFNNAYLIRIEFKKNVVDMDVDLFGTGIDSFFLRITCLQVAEANATALQETELQRRRKRRSEQGTSRASFASTVRKGKPRRRRRRRKLKKGMDEEDEEEDLTPISPSEASKLEFK